MAIGRIGRNDPCPCESGKKYKRCCLAKDQQAKSKERREKREAWESVIKNENNPNRRHYISNYLQSLFQEIMPRREESYFKEDIKYLLTKQKKKNKLPT